MLMHRNHLKFHTTTATSENLPQGDFCDNSFDEESAVSHEDVSATGEHETTLHRDCNFEDLTLAGVRINGNRYARQNLASYAIAEHQTDVSATGEQEVRFDGNRYARQNLVSYGQNLVSYVSVNQDRKFVGNSASLVDEFLGRVDEVIDDIAFVTLQHADGAEIQGERHVSEFGELILKRGDYFECRVFKDIAGGNSFEFSAARRMRSDKVALSQLERDLDSIYPPDEE